ncbi:MAG: peptidoglycan-associated lipoprotein Pal [Gammaproteobacteria bacterium]|nr:peptidoglycan-associated lipoprotein Pal [Gammaproteobacteria bacterium]
MMKKFWMLATVVSVLLLAACASQQPAGDTPVDEGAQTSGAGADQGMDAGDVSSERVVHFEFDSSAIDAEGAAIVEANAKYLNANTSVSVRLEGHCDERGTREYNLALGERRAKAVERMLKALGVSGARIKTVSYGEEKPVDGDHNESAWRQNRRVEIKY